MTRKEFFIKLDNFFNQPGNFRLGLITSTLYVLTLHISGIHISNETTIGWFLYDLFDLWLTFSALGVLTYQFCLFSTKRFLEGEITINKILVFSLITWSICIPICIWVDWVMHSGIYETNSFYILLIFCILVSSVSIIQACGNIIKQRNEEKLKMVEEIKSEREKTARAQLNTLKLQLDPHFMFNSLGTLSGIIVENPQKALDFTSRLTRIYKYIVAHLDQDSITLREGMRFIQDYCKHIEMRYKNHFVFDIASNICHDDEELILPLSLQLLVENAVKHNQHSEEHPLHIRIYRDDDFVCVSNELAPYTIIGYSKEEGTGIGIKNLFDRYKMLTDKIPIILQSDTTYTVQIPIVKKTKELK